MWHKADWDKVRENPKSVQFPREDWIHTHDAELHAEESFDENFEQVRTAPTGIAVNGVTGVTVNGTS